MPKQHRHELEAEAREQERPPPFDDELDDVAREHEGERDENREVRGRQRVEHDVGEEIRVNVDERLPSASSPASASSSAMMPVSRSGVLSRNGLRP